MHLMLDWFPATRWWCWPAWLFLVISTSTHHQLNGADTKRWQPAAASFLSPNGGRVWKKKNPPNQMLNCILHLRHSCDMKRSRRLTCTFCQLKHKDWLTDKKDARRVMAQPVLKNTHIANSQLIPWPEQQHHIIVLAPAGPAWVRHHTYLFCVRLKKGGVCS